MWRSTIIGFVLVASAPHPAAAAQKGPQFRATEKRVIQIEAGIINSAHCRTKDLVALSLRNGKEIVLWDLDAWKEKTKFPVQDRFQVTLNVDAMAFNTDGKKLAFRRWDTLDLSNGIEVLAVDSGMTIHSFQRVAGPIAFHPNGQSVALYAGQGNLQLRDLNKSDVVQREIKLKEKKTLGFLVLDLVYSPDGKSLAVTSSFPSPENKDKNPINRKIENRKVEIFDSITGEQHRTLECSDKTTSVQFDHSGATLATWIAPARSRGTQFREQRQAVELWDPSNGKLKRRVKFNAPVRTVAFSGDGKWLAAASEGENCVVSVYEASTGDEICSIKTNDAICNGLYFAKDGSLVYAGANILRSFKLEKK